MSTEPTTPERKRPPIRLTAAAASSATYGWVAAKPENAGKTPAELLPLAKELLAGMIRKGAFIITDAEGAR
jgi:hypothetical protein